MSNDVHIKITADKADTSGIKGAKDDLDGLKAKAKETIPVIEGLRQSVGDSNKEFLDTSRQLKSLDDSIAGSNHLLKQLAGAFADTDDAAQKIDIKKAMDRIQSDLTTATKARKLITPIEPRVEPSKLKALVDDLTYTAKTAAANWKPILGAGIVAAAPLIGSALSGAIIGGAGIGGVIGGILLVKDDPRVIGAAQGLKTRVGDQLKTAAQPFVDTTVKGLATIETSLHRIDFEGIFKKASTFVQPLSTAVGHVAEDLGSGFGALIQVADPVIKSISHGLEGIGQAAEDGMKSLTDNADTAASSLGTLLDGVKNAVTGTFALVNGLTELKAKFDSGADGIFAFDAGLKIFNEAMPHGNGTKWVDAVTAFNDAVAAGVGTVDSYGQAITTTGQSLGDMATQALAASNAQRSLFDAATSVGEAEDNLTASVKKNGHTFDENTAKGRANRTALSGVVSSLNATYAAAVASGDAGAHLNGVAQKNYDSFMSTAHAAGISAKAARGYARDLGLIPPKKTTDVHANTHDAAARIAALQGQIDRLRGKTVTIRTVITGGSLAGGVHVSGPGGSGTLTKAAGGMIGRSADGASPAGLTWVGEQGPELISAQPGSRVWSAGDSARMAGKSNSGDGSKMIVVNLVVDGRTLATTMVEPQRELVRTLGAGSVQQYYGQPGRN